MSGTDFRNTVQEKIKMQRSINITFPSQVAESLEDYSNQYTNGCYWLAFKQLLDFFNSNKNDQTMIKLLKERDDFNFSLLSKRIDELQKDFESLIESKEEGTEIQFKKRGFGSGRNE